MDPHSGWTGWLDDFVSSGDRLRYALVLLEQPGFWQRHFSTGCRPTAEYSITNLTGTMHHLWAPMTSSPLFGVTLTVLSYAIGLAVQRACKGAAVANPVLIAILLVAGLLKATGTSYQTYFVGGQFIHFLLGPATVALAVPLVKNLEYLKRNLLGVVLAVTAGSLVSAFSGFALVELCGGTRQVALSMAPKAVTSPIAMDVAQVVGGIPALSAILAISSGIFVATFIQPLLRWVKTKDAQVFGLAAGNVGSGIGAAHAIRLNEIAGAFASVAIAFNGLLTALAVPLLIHFWPH
jgi:putative effector of murein hydrolase